MTSRLLAAVAIAISMSAGLSGCGGDPIGEAEQAATDYFNATNTGEWDIAAEASVGWARGRAMYYKYASAITGLPSGVLHNVDATNISSAQIEELTETETDGVLAGTVRFGEGPDEVVIDAEFATTDDGLKVSDYEDRGFPLSGFWSLGDSTDSSGGLVLTSLVGRMGRTAGYLIANYQWVSVVQNDNSWPVAVDAIEFSPSSGAASVTWRPEAQPPVSGATIAAQEEVPPGHTASIWVRQDATGVSEGGGTLKVTLSGAGTSRELSVDLPQMSPPPGWQTSP